MYSSDNNNFSDVQNNIEKLKLNSGLSRIGGKGTVRRKKKNNNCKIKQKIIKSQDDIKLENCIKTINDLLHQINNEDDYTLFKIWLEDNIFYYFEYLSKYEVVNKNILEYIYEEPIDFFYENFTIECDTLQFQGDINILRSILNKNGIEYILTFYIEIRDILCNKKYLDTDNNDNSDDILTTRECLQTLDINTTDDVSEKEIKMAYKKMALQLHPDRHPGEEDLYQDKFKFLSKCYRKLLSDYN